MSNESAPGRHHPVNQRWLAHLSLLLSAAALLACGFFLFVPLQVYLGNIYEYSIPTGTMIRFLAVWALIAFVAVVFPGILLPVRARRWYCLLLCGFALAAYIQSNYLVWDYGLLDGKELRWDENETRGHLDLLIWVVVIGVIFWRRKWILAHGTLVALALLGVQTVAALFALFTKEKAPSHHYYSIDESELVTFSPTRNVILVILDSFQSNTFAGLLEAEPELREHYRGFVYFPDAVAGYAKTMGSVPNILTGQFYDNHRPMEEFLREGYEHSILPQLKSEGFRVELYPITDKLVQFDRRLFSNIVEKKAARFLGPEMAAVFDISAFRGAPHAVKKWVVGDGAWVMSRALLPASRRSDGRTGAGDSQGSNGETWFRDSRFRDLDFHRALGSAKVSVDPTPRFKFIHLGGPHEPFLYDVDLVPRRLPHGSEGYLRQARGSLRILNDLLGALGELGVYDRTDVIVVSDHGAGEYRISPPGVAAAPAEDAVPEFVRSSGLPLVMMKRAADRADFRVSDNQVALADVAPTIASLAGLPVPGDARQLDEKKHPEPRTRRYYNYFFEGWDRRFLPPLTEYEVRGNSWEPDSWKGTGRVLHPGTKEDPKAVAARSEANGKKWDFGAGQDGMSLLGSGWGEPEPGFVWTDSHVASIRIPNALPAEASVLEFIAKPFLVPGRIDSQAVEVSVNGRRTASWIMDQQGKYGVPLLEEEDGDSGLALEFFIPTATAPKDVRDNSQDPRTLGFSLSSLEHRAMPEFPVDGVLRFTTEGNARPYQLWGWGGPDPSSTWTNGRSAAIAVFLGRKGKPRELVVKASPYLARGLLPAQRVEIRIAGEVVASQAISATTEWTVPLSAAEEGWKVVEFLLPDAAAPIDHPTDPTPDPRFLGLRVESVAIEDRR